MTDTLHLLSAGWAAFSVGATIAGVGGVGLILLALLAAASLPSWLRTPLLGVGILLLVGAALFQAGQAKGSHDAFALTAAEKLRDAKAKAEADLREARRQAAAGARISAADTARADAAEAAANAARARLAELQRHLARTPDRACASDADARLLRGL